MRMFHFSYPREPSAYNKHKVTEVTVNLEHITHVDWKSYQEEDKASIYLIGKEHNVMIQGEENLKRLRKALRVREERKSEANISDGFKR